ncbi:SIS domain-containing protein [Nocardioides sp. ChNu-99]|uniref:SIS domain-containing protein n=1 Tax=Nocardioides sp. ChNu-99 TaxID=2839897 RepID=UPI002406B8D1|nr:SIS domain-containing protein [Nocardioides sp. ChNu-99]MDF9717560.1 hypothetical protein [Nocardioides sp. ChNu-99]
MWFDESRLDDERALAGADARLRALAESGARVRREAQAAAEAVDGRVREARERPRPRAVVAAGAEARLLRAVLEAGCPVPLVAWSAPGLPGWTGSLDLVVVLAPGGDDVAAAGTVAEAVRRGADVLVACPPASLVADHAAGRDVVLLPTTSGDPLAAAVVALDFLAGAGLGRSTDPEVVALALDDVAVRCSPYRDIAGNPAKEAAIGLADAAPLVWGGTPLAARAARRVAEALRSGSGRAALAGDAEQLLPVLEAARPRDVFADPFDGDGGASRPVLLVLDDGSDDPRVREQGGHLRAVAAAHDVRVVELRHDDGGEVARYASLLLQGWYAAAYLGLGLVPA